MTNLELIQSFDADSMAVLLAQICYERDEMILKKLAEQGIDVSLMGLTPKLQVEIHRAWLLEKAEI